MKTIIYNKKIYKVTNREFNVIEKMIHKQLEAAASICSKEFFKLGDDVREYLDVAVNFYQYKGDIDMIVDV
jgi:hypothetical protein